MSWADTFFADALWQELQRGAWSEQQTRADADEIARWLELGEPADLLDVPCGEGRIAIELARRGHRVTGVDVSGPMIDTARSRAAGVAVDLSVGDMRELAFDRAFDAAYCWWGSFGYFEDAENERFVARVARALRPGGRFAIEMVNLAEALLPRFSPREWNRSGKILSLHERAIDLARGRLDATFTLIHDDGRRSALASSMRLYTYRDLVALLERAGFEDVRAYDRSCGKPFAVTANGARLAVVARRA